MSATSASSRRWITSGWLLSAAAVVLLALAFLIGRRTARETTRTETVQAPPSPGTLTDAGGVTNLWAHNVLLRKGPYFRVYIRWIRGRMVRTDAKRIPSFDATDSFVLGIDKGIIDAKLADVAEYLNSDPQGKPPLADMKVENHDGELQIKGMAHKLVPVPVRLDGDVSPTPDGRVKFHLKKLNVLKVPMKGLFGAFHVELSDLLPKELTPGMQIDGNDIYFDTQRLLPPPHIKGKITSIQLIGDRIHVIYGGAAESEQELAQWHNFLRLSGGTVSFAKLTMQHADLTLIDATNDPWFDLDLTNYQTQLVYGDTHITPRAGVEVYMPDLDHLPPEAKKAAKGVTLQWLKDRNTAPPYDPAPAR